MCTGIIRYYKFFIGSGYLCAQVLSARPAATTVAVVGFGKDRCDGRWDTGTGYL